MPEHQPVATAEPATPDRDQWFEETEELPRRPRRRLLGVVAGGNPIALALLGVLLIACGFIGGVLVEKGETSSSGSSSAAAGASGLAARFRALRGAATGTGTSSTGSSSAGGSSSFGSGFARPTAGTVAYLAGSTLYVTNAEGNTVKVTTSAGTSVTKTVKSDVGAIHPGETVTVTGAAGSNGAVSAEAISIGASGGLAALFGGGGGGGGKASAGSGPSSSGSSREPQLFGSGG